MKITLYSVPSCPMCKMLKKLIDGKHLEYNYIEDPQAIIDKGYTHAPLLEVDGKIMTYSEAFKFIQEV